MQVFKKQTESWVAKKSWNWPRANQIEPPKYGKSAVVSKNGGQGFEDIVFVDY